MTQHLAPVPADPSPSEFEAQPETSPADRVWLFAAFRVSSSHPIVLDGRDVPGVVRELEDVVGIIEGEGVRVRGWYDVTGFRSDTDLLVWLTGTAAEDLQWAYRELRRARILKPLVRVSSFVAVTGAELPAEAPGWLAVTGAGAGFGARAVNVSASDGIEAVEAESSAALFHALTGESSAAPLHLGRLITPAEVIEVLQ
ncbi:MAG: chlorite dismutase family protein [Leucobacter sp.]